MPKSAHEPIHLEKIIDEALTALEGLSPATDEYNRIVDQLTSLYALLPEKQGLIKPEMFINVIGNLAGIVAILGYEHAHTITSKALSFVKKI